MKKMNKSLFGSFMPYCAFAKDDLICLCNRDYKVVYSGRLENPITVREISWIANGLQYEEKDGVMRFYFYKEDPTSKSHPEYSGNEKIDGKVDPSSMVNYYLRINRLMEIADSVRELSVDEKPQIKVMLSPFMDVGENNC